MGNMKYTNEKNKYKMKMEENKLEKKMADTEKHRSKKFINGVST